MLSNFILPHVVATVLIFAAAPRLIAQVTVQSPTPAPSSKPAQTQHEEQEPVKVFTEEVRLPVFAYDGQGRFDPTVELEDILVHEDGVQQKIRSVRRIPPNVLLLLDTGSQMTLAKSTNTTRAIALHLLASLRADDQVAVMQFGDRVELLQGWTENGATIRGVLKTKLHSGRRGGLLSEALVAAADELKERPAGSRHIVLITDGVEAPGGKVRSEEAVKKLMAAQATVHIISYTTLVRQAIEQRYGSVAQGGTGRQKDATVGGDPTMPPGATRNPSFTLGRIDLDRGMRRHYKKYGEETRESERRLTTLAEETGGRILLPKSTEEMIKQGDEVARDIGSQYVVTYTPKRPLESAVPGEYRRVDVTSRRAGLYLRTRHGYIVTPTAQ